MGMPQFQLMGMMGGGGLGLSGDSPASQMKIPTGPGLLGDMPLPQLNNSTVLPLTSGNSVPDEDDRMGGDDNNRKRTNVERGDRERLVSLYSPSLTNPINWQISGSIDLPIH